MIYYKFTTFYNYDIIYIYGVPNMNVLDSLKNDINAIINNNQPLNYLFLNEYPLDMLKKVLFIMEKGSNYNDFALQNISLYDMEKYFKIIKELVLIDNQYPNDNMFLFYILFYKLNEQEIRIMINDEIDLNTLYHYICGYKLFNPSYDLKDGHDFQKTLLLKDQEYGKKLVDAIKNHDFGKLKETYMYFVYSLNDKQVDYLVNYYGRYINALGKSISSQDLEIFNTLKDICYVAKQATFSEEAIISLLKMINEKMDTKRDYSLFYHLDVALKKMYMHTYNNSLTKIEDLSLAKEVDNVKVYEASNNFLLALHSMEKSKGYGDSLDDDSSYYIDYHAYAQNWDKSSKVGLSTTIIGASNMGVMPSNFYLGFNHFDEDSLEIVAPFDAFTSNYQRSFLADYFKEENSNYFVPANLLLDETRYGYNEMFNYTYSKIKPSYLVTFNNISQNSEIVKCAKAFGIPIIHIDYEKVIGQVVLDIKNKEEELFKSNKLDNVSYIICKYMNLSASSIINAHDFSHQNPKYLMINELKNFLVRFKEKVDSFSDVSVKKKWLFSLYKTYNEEYQKYLHAKKVQQYQHLISTFVLDDSRYVEMGKYLVESYKGLNEEIINIPRIK